MCHRKHFGWWCTNQLLPAALLSKPGVLAVAVARLILGHDPAPPEMKDYPVIQGAPEPSSPLPAEEISHYDKVHGSSFKPSKFEAFIIEQYQRSGGGAFSESAKAAATLLLNGEDFRAQLTKSESHPVVWEIRRSFQPMPSQTEMIERGVKETHTVSVTGCQEEQQSNYCIVCSAHILRLEEKHGQILAAEVDDTPDTPKKQLSAPDKSQADVEEG